ncbi:MAG: RES domain-containing protein [Pedobacter sp.]|nr:MAG: RES domain-containing protein [Pedobacter sp.]
MRIYRLSDRQFAADLDGTGAKLFGGRWNHVGTSCIYTSASRALSVLEFAANVELEFFPSNLSITIYEVADKEILTISDEELPENWNDLSSPKSTKDFGTNLLMNSNTLCIQVPSVVVLQEFNYLINPACEKIKLIKVVDINKFEFDTRVKK